MEMILNNLNSLYSNFNKSGKIKEVMNQYKDKWLPSQSEANLILNNRIKPEITITKENLHKIDEAIKETSLKTSNINLESSKSNLTEIDEYLQKLQKLKKEREIWSKIFDKLKLHRTLLFSGDYKRNYTEEQKELQKLLVNSKIASEIVREFFKFNETENDYNNLVEELNKLTDKKSLIKLANQIIIAYGKTDHEINSGINISEKISLMNSLFYLINNIIKDNKELLDLVSKYKEEHDKLAVEYSLLSSYKRAQLMREFITSLQELVDKSEEANEIIELKKQLDEVNINNLIKDLIYETESLNEDTIKLYEEDRRNNKKFILEVGILNGGFVNKSILLNNLIFKKSPKDKDDLEYIKESILILYVYIRLFSLESYSPLVTYTF